MGKLYDNNKSNWDKLARDGRPAVAEMAKRFLSATDMDRAMGLKSSACHWASGRNGASGGSEVLAELWLRANPIEPPTAPPPAPLAAPTQGRVLMVVCNDATVDRAMKMLGILGCEVVEV